MLNKKLEITIEKLGDLLEEHVVQYQPFLLYKVADIIDEYYDRPELTSQQQIESILWYSQVALGYAGATISPKHFSQLLNLVSPGIAKRLGIKIEEFIKACITFPKDNTDRCIYLLSKLGDLDKAPQAMIASVNILAFLQDIDNGSEIQGWKTILGTTVIKP